MKMTTDARETIVSKNPPSAELVTAATKTCSALLMQCGVIISGSITAILLYRQFYLSFI
jgi:hypothetical protein